MLYHGPVSSGSFVIFGRSGPHALTGITLQQQFEKSLFFDSNITHGRKRCAIRNWDVIFVFFCRGRFILAILNVSLVFWIVVYSSLLFEGGGGCHCYLCRGRFILAILNVSLVFWIVVYSSLLFEGGGGATVISLK